MRKLFILLCLFIFILDWSLSIHAEEYRPASMSHGGSDTGSYAGRIWSDLKELPTLPLSFSRTQWIIAGGVGVATIGTLAYDTKTQKEVRERSTDLYDDVSFYSTHFGDYHYQVPIHTYLWAIGTASNYTPLKKSAADGVEASLFSAGLVTPLITAISGRSLPLHNENPMKFHPFHFGAGHESFPSGHTTEAFAMAAVLDKNFRETFGYYHTPFLFSLAAGTGFSRMYDNKHYLSDVVLGASIGTSIGYWIADKPFNVPSSIFLWPIPGGFAFIWEF